MSAEYNGIAVFDDDASTYTLERSLDGRFHQFHVCCGCHKVHAVSTVVKNDGHSLVTTWSLPSLRDSERITKDAKAATVADLLEYEHANESAWKEIERLRCEIAGLDAQRRADALSGQAALDQANNEIVRLRAKLEFGPHLPK